MKIRLALQNLAHRLSVKFKINIPKIKSPAETIEDLINTKSSICRFGDGEFTLMEGKSIPFQDTDDRLANRLKEVFESEDENIFIATNYFYWGSIDDFHPSCKNFYKNFIPANKKRIESFLKKGKQYYDAGFTQPYAAFANYDFETHYQNVKRIFGDKDITIICGETVFDKIETNIFNCAKSVEYIYAPSKNAFSEYDDILEKANQINKNNIIIIILGPTASILAYDLAKEGYQALDLGHIAKDYDCFKKKIQHNTQTIVDFFDPD